MQMETKWYIEKDFFWEGKPDTLLSILKEMNVPFELGKVHSVKPFPYRVDDCVVVYGSIEFVREVNQLMAWVPGDWVFGNKQNFYCSSYYSHYSDFLFNQEFFYMPLADLYRKKNFVFDVLSSNEWLFVRPDSPFKEFTGVALHRNEVCKKIPAMSYGDLAPNLMVLIAPVKRIKSEYRFYVAKDEVIAGSRYKLNDEHDEDPICPQGAYDIALKVAQNEWLPSPVFSVDIGENGYGDFKLLEINGFNTSDMYWCDLKKIVTRVNEVAMKEWENYQKETT